MRRIHSEITQEVEIYFKPSWSSAIRERVETQALSTKKLDVQTPAKAFIKFTKGHTGYYSCTKCVMEGEYINNRVCFPNLNKFRDRTDFDFRSKFQKEHHINSKISDLESIQHLDMIIPVEFNRVPRSLEECTRWKVTEFRQFLLYTGPIVLHSILNRDNYLNFLTLNVAVTLLSSVTYRGKYLNYANSL
ncbi:uncharacterized protein [Cardiocondyla obscurior]|uniref:uncharacterized protein n=1 Tax=Cardiocondyla obscurior TaxID=286306 RepID=UPI0039656316